MYHMQNCGAGLLTNFKMPFMFSQSLVPLMHKRKGNGKREILATENGVNRVARKKEHEIKDPIT